MNMLLRFLIITCTLFYVPAAAQNTAADTALTYRIIPAQGKGFGYEIDRGGKPLIRQLSVPGRAGNDGFRTKAAAQQVARLVIRKLRNGEMPPTITEAELRKIGHGS